MLERARPDLVTTSLPNEGHFEPTLDADPPRRAAAGREAAGVQRRRGRAADRRGRGRRDLFFAINFNHRYAEAVQRAHAAIEAGELGELVHVTWRFGGEANPGQSPHRNLFETQCHGFDMLEHLAGPISSVMAQMTNKTDAGASTTRWSIAVAFSQPRGREPARQLRHLLRLPRHAVHRDQRHARARADPRHGAGARSSPRAGEETHQVWRPGYFNDLGRTFTHTFDRHVEDILAALRAGDRATDPRPRAGGARWCSARPRCARSSRVCGSQT